MIRDFLGPISYALVLCLSIIGCTHQQRDNSTIKGLKVDYLAQPLGIDSKIPRFSWQIESVNRGKKQTAYELEVSTVDKDIYWSTYKVSSSDQHNISYSGRALIRNTRFIWKVRFWDENDDVSEWSDPSWFETAMMYNSHWSAEWIFDGVEAPVSDEEFYRDIPNPIFRKEFTIGPSLINARLYIVGLGYSEGYLNGKKIGDHVLDPGWTNYAKEISYATYDVLDLVTEGDNVLSASLGNGWYNPLPLQLFKKYNLRDFLTIGSPKLLAELHLNYKDGTHEIIKTDKTWKSSHGAILRNNIYLGEKVDNRLRDESWKENQFNDDSWAFAQVTSSPGGKLIAQQTPPVRITKTITPIAITEPEPGVYVVDFGQNIAGWIKMDLSGIEGQEVRFRYGEHIYESGMVNFMTSVIGQIKEVWNMNGGPGAPPTAYQEDMVILNGDGKEYFQPQFTFHGFRYVEIRGYDELPNLNSITAMLLNSDVDQVGEFNCSNKLFNKIQEITDWTFRSNIFSVQSDCPAREKFGYGADIVAVTEAYMFNYWMPNFYEKTVRDFSNDQRANGGMPETAPYNGIDSKGLGGTSGPIGWQLAFPFVQERLYKFYGNKDIIVEQYPAILRMMTHLQEAAGDNHFIEFGIGDHESISPLFEALTSTAFYYHHVSLAGRFANILGKTSDESRFNNLAKKIKEAFLERFYNFSSGQFENELSVANQTFALFYDLIPPNEKRKVLDVLLKEIQENQNGHLNTGIFGTKMLYDILRDHDEGEIAFNIVNQKDFPGYGHMIANNATTLWESWEFNQHKSLNHPMFGSVSEWFFRSVLGINQTDSSIAFSEILIQPRNTNQLEWANGSYKTLYGQIRVEWKKMKESFEINITIPSNTTAIIAIPIHFENSIIVEKEGFKWEKGKTLAVDDSIVHLRSDAKYHFFKVGSGSYNFIDKMKNE